MKEGSVKTTKKVEFSRVKDEEGVVKAKEGDVKTVEKETKTKCKDLKMSEPSKKKGKEFKPPTKVVVRRLPPTMTEEEFLQQIDPLPPVDFMYYVQADNSLAPNHFCRAYLNFVNQSDIFIFTQKFDNYVFVDSKGVEYPAVVEFAPFQRIPKQRQNKKKDSKCSTLSADPFYISFLEKLETEAQEMLSANNNAKQHFFETTVDSNEGTKVSSTPLLDFLHNRHQERRRLREEKRKKDLERKKAREDMKKAAKKTEDESPSTVKVLHSNTVNKEKLKDKENSRFAANKKRNEERVKEPKEHKVRVGKSYHEEKQKQIEKREEQKRKVAQSKFQKSTSDDKKVGESAENYDVNERNYVEDNSQENTPKAVEENNKKETNSCEQTSFPANKQYVSSQKYQEYKESQRTKKEEERRRFREERAQKRREERERREEQYKSKKAAGTEKKNHEHNDRNRERPSSSNYKKVQSANSFTTDRRSKNTKTSRSEVLVDESTDKKPIGMNLTDKDRNESTKEDINDEYVGDSDKKIERNSSSRLDNSVAGDIRVPNRDSSKSLVNADENYGKERDKDDRDSKGTLKLKSHKKAVASTVEPDKDVSVETRDDNFGNHSEHRSDDKDDGIDLESSSRPKMNRLGSLLVHDDMEVGRTFSESEPGKEISSKETTENVFVKCENDSLTKEFSYGTDLEQSDREVKMSGILSSEEKREEGIKRRNSMEMYKDGKEEGSEKHKRRESGRRNSLESGDQTGPLKPLSERVVMGKELGDSKEGLQGDDPRTKRRIRNKDRPSMEIYRPGMGRFSKQRLERDKVGSSTEVDSPSPSPSPTPVPKHKHSNNNSGSQSRAA